MSSCCTKGRAILVIEAEGEAGEEGAGDGRGRGGRG